MIWGTRVSLMAGLVSVAIAAVAGSAARALARATRAAASTASLMRLMDAVLSFPALVLALALGAVLGAGLTGVLIALGVVYTPTFARLMRGQVLTIRGARVRRGGAGARRAAAGGSPGATCCRTRPRRSWSRRRSASPSRSWPRRRCRSWGSASSRPTPSWGSMINAGRGYLQQAPWIVFGPGAALFVTVLGLNFVGDAIRDALDPRA